MLWHLHLKNNSSVSGRGPQVMALMDHLKHEPWNTAVGSDIAFVPVPAFLDGKSKDSLSHSVQGWTNLFHNSELMLSFLVSNYFSLLHLHLIFHFKKPHGLFLYHPIHCFLGNIRSSPLNTYTVCSLDLLSLPKKLYLPFALAIEYTQR